MIHLSIVQYICIILISAPAQDDEHPLISNRTAEIEPTQESKANIKDDLKYEPNAHASGKQFSSGATQNTHVLQESENEPYHKENTRKTNIPSEHDEGVNSFENGSLGVIKTSNMSEAKIPTETTSGIKRYPMAKNPSGHCLIISNTDFSEARQNGYEFKDREGSLVDVQRLKKLFVWLKFKVTVCEDMTADQMKNILKTFSKSDHTSCNAFVCCILTHGCPRGLCGIDGIPLNMAKITRLFNGEQCKTLQNKPKLFFLQFCRGFLADSGYSCDGISARNTTDAEKFDDTRTAESTDPLESDFFIGYPTPPGK